MQIEQLSFIHLYWIKKENGMKCYEGEFKSGKSLYRWTSIIIRFWATNPKQAMEYIVENSKTVKDVRGFDGKEIIFK